MDYPPPLLTCSPDGVLYNKGNDDMPPYSPPPPPPPALPLRSP